MHFFTHPLKVAEISLWSLLRFLSTEEVDECHGYVTVLADGPTVPLIRGLQHAFIVSILRQLWGHDSCSTWCCATCEQTRAGCVSLGAPSQATHHECLRLTINIRQVWLVNVEHPAVRFVCTHFTFSTMTAIFHGFTKSFQESDVIQSKDGPWPFSRALRTDLWHSLNSATDHNGCIEWGLQTELVIHNKIALNIVEVCHCWW